MTPRLDIGTAGLSVWYSNDLGETLERFWGTSGLYSETRIWALSSHPDRPGDLIAGTDSGIYRLDIASGKWTHVPSPMDTLCIWSVALSPHDADLILAGTRPPGIFRSTDGAKTCERVDAPLPETCPAVLKPRVTKIQFDPDDPDLVNAITRLDTLNPNDPKVPRVLGRLGRLYLLRHRDADAERVLRRAQVIMEQAPGYYPPEWLAFVLTNLGAVYLEQHRDHDAAGISAGHHELRQRADDQTKYHGSKKTQHRSSTTRLHSKRTSTHVLARFTHRRSRREHSGCSRSTTRKQRQVVM